MADIIAQQIIDKLFAACVEGRLSPNRIVAPKQLEDAILRLSLLEAHRLLQHFNYGRVNARPNDPPVTDAYNLLYERLYTDFKAILAEENAAGLLHLIPDRDGEITGIFYLLDAGVKLETPTGARLYVKQDQLRDPVLVVHYSAHESATVGFGPVAVKEAIGRINRIIVKENEKRVFAAREAKAA